MDFDTAIIVATICLLAGAVAVAVIVTWDRFRR